MGRSIEDCRSVVNAYSGFRAAISFAREGVEKKDDFWGIQGSSYITYEKYFSELNVSFEKILKEKTSPTIIDLLSTSTAIRGIIEDMQIPNPKGISVSLTDHRSKEEKIYDSRLGITHISGDLGKLSTWKRIETELNSKKADLIIERGCGGLSYLPNHPFYYFIAMDKIWNMLSSQNGVFVGDWFFYALRSPSLKEQWVKSIRLQDIDVKDSKNGVVIIKHPESPRKFPYPSI